MRVRRPQNPSVHGMAVEAKFVKKLSRVQLRFQAYMRYRVTVEGLEPSAIVIKANFLFLSSSSDDVTFDYAPRKTGNEAEPSNF